MADVKKNGSEEEEFVDNPSEDDEEDEDAPDSEDDDWEEEESPKKKGVRGKGRGRGRGAAAAKRPSKGKAAVKPKKSKTEEEDDDEDDIEDEEEEEESESSGQEDDGKDPTKKEFKSGKFVVLKKDLTGTELPPIWKIDGKVLLQKFMPFEKDGKTLYKSTSTYSGWSHHNRDQYRAAPVKLEEEGPNECIVEFLKDTIPAEEEETVTPSVEAGAV